jgi:pilus biogenesis lipoprotein CpaD
MMMKKTTILMLFVATAAGLAACGRQSTPSMMNTSLPQIVPETTLEQMPIENVTQSYLYNIADNYERYGVDTMQISLAYDPASKKYNAMKAFEDLAAIKAKLKKLGVRSITGETVKSEGATPTLMISYDSVTAQAPAGCRNMPGFDDGLTTTQITDYRFGCSVDTMLAKQIYRPADLQGSGAGDPIDGRRATNTVEYYRQVETDEAEGELNDLDRSDMQ